MLDISALCVIVPAVSKPRPCGRQRASPVPRALPAAVALAAGAACGAEGLAPDLPARVDAVVGAEIARGSFPGAVVAIGRREGLVFIRPYGMAAVTNDPAPMRADTIFDIASLSKAVATAPAVLMLVEQGKLGDRKSVV